MCQQDAHAATSAVRVWTLELESDASSVGSVGEERVGSELGHRNLSGCAGKPSLIWSLVARRVRCVDDDDISQFYLTTSGKSFIFYGVATWRRGCNVETDSTH